jgi:hypothetical protein
MSAAQIVRFHRRRGDAENILMGLKGGFGNNTMPCGTLLANAAYSQTILLACNLMQWLGRAALPDAWLRRRSRRFGSYSRLWRDGLCATRGRGRLNCRIRIRSTTPSGKSGNSAPDPGYSRSSRVAYPVDDPSHAPQTFRSPQTRPDFAPEHAQPRPHRSAEGPLPGSMGVS